MKNGTTQYAGIAAGFVLGAGLLLVGFNLPVEMHDRAVSMRWAGVALLAAAVVMFLLSRACSTTRALFCSVGSAICSILLLYSAANGEFTGKTVYHRKFLSHLGWRTEAVTREGAPEKFRVATNVRWALGVGFALVSGLSFVLYRKAKEVDEVEAPL